MTNDTAAAQWHRVVHEFALRHLSQSTVTTTETLHVRSNTNVDRLLGIIILSSVPALLVGAWSTGDHLLAAEIATPGQLATWRLLMLAALGLSTGSGGLAAPMLIGLSFALPLLALSAIVSVVWEIVFASIRRRNIDPGWPMASWFFVLLLPAATPLWLVALGISFGVVFGKHIFGGTGRYIASPALLGALFLHFSYPSLVADASVWKTLVNLGPDGVSAQGMTWWHFFAGYERAPLGVSSALCCIIGALWLLAARIASLRTLIGALAGLAASALAASWLGAQLPMHWHFVAGSFAFCWAFVLTDPTTLPLTRVARWLHGFTFGSLVILIRTADPTHPEATLFAALLASLLVPLFDYIALRIHVARFQGKMEIAR